MAEPEPNHPSTLGPRHATLTAAALTPNAFAAQHQAILRRGREYAESLHTRPRPPRLADVITWLPQLTVEAHLHAMYASSRRPLAAAAAWTVDAALATEDPVRATTARTAAADLARARLTDALAHPDSDRIGTMAQRCAQALALALDTTGTPAARHTALTAAHAELITLAVVHERPLPPPLPVRPIGPPRVGPPPPAPWTTRAAATHARHAACPQQHGRALRRGRSALAHAAPGAPSGDLAGIVATLPGLTLDAIGLEIGGGRLAAREERVWLAHAATRAAAALARADHALPPELRAHPETLKHARQRLHWIETAHEDEDDPVLDGTHDLATWLADAQSAATADAAAGALLLAAGELLAIVLLAQAPQQARRLGRASLARATPIRRRR